MNIIRFFIKYTLIVQIMSDSEAFGLFLKAPQLAILAYNYNW